MKRIALLPILAIFSFPSLAQTSAVDDAAHLQQSGQLAEAKSKIDQAIADHRTKESARAWYVYGLVHEDIFNSQDRTVQSLDPLALEHTVQGYNRVMELEPVSGMHHKLAATLIDNLWTRLINKGSGAYQGGRNAEAILWFDKAKVVRPSDTSAYLYAGVAAQGIDDIPTQLKNFRKLAEMGYQDVHMYRSLVYYTKTYEKDPYGALEWVREAQKYFPADSELKSQELNLLIETGQKARAKTALQEAIATQPRNPVLLFNLGYILEEEGQKDEALEYYQRAADVDPEYFDPVYNLGVYYFKKAADMYKMVNAMPVDEYNARGKQVEGTAREHLEKSMPYMEQASNIRPNQAHLWNTLSMIYDRLGMTAKAEAAQGRYQGLSGG